MGTPRGFGTVTWKKYRKHTLFMCMQHEQLEVQFNGNRFPNKNLQKELALELYPPESTTKTSLRRRVKSRKQKQQQLSLKQPNQILPATNVPTPPTTSTSPYYFPPRVSDSHSSLPPQPIGPSNLAWDPVITENPTSDVQMQGPQLEGLEPSVPVLFLDTYTIEQIVELYSFSDDISISPTGPS
ncbi:arginine-fifty homeobox [Myotis daubentonii]|uniref:arginine-fifty homeobox n=1 Tax=Myotis daubentonii TaxID=98922 RepID=UPI002873D614|nr:arginine-fifty homeobox [Myotis daubentonii]